MAEREIPPVAQKFTGFGTREEADAFIAKAEETQRKAERWISMADLRERLIMALINSQRNLPTFDDIVTAAKTFEAYITATQEKAP